VIAIACYALLAIAWIIDLLTPQLFVAAVLLNGPIALSTLALRPGLTLRLTILAEIANVAAGYVNGLQAGHHWDAIALGDRVLSAASFLLVGALTMRAQETAHRAGETAERERQIAGERGLRHAMEKVRASLNVELVLRAAVREALALTGAERAAIYVRESSLDVPQRYELRRGEPEVSVAHEALRPELSSIVERARGETVLAVDPNDAVGRLFGEAALVAVVDEDDVDTVLLLAWPEALPGDTMRATVAAFVENFRVALKQTRLFVRLAEQNAEIARQRDAIVERSDVIRDIVYALAHDLRTPLSAADVTMTQAIAGAFGELPERYRSVLETSLASNADIRRLVETLLLVARYESGEDSRAFSEHDLVALARRVVDEQRIVADAKGVALALAAPADAVEIVADGDEVRRAIANLVANAIEATPAQGHVEVNVGADAAAATVAVVDDGFGVPLERRGALFQRFGGVRGGGGTGLGLYIVRRIAEKYQGSASYEPREPRGSRFVFRLPRGTAA
jgi:signal transduction histidine kinase